MLSDRKECTPMLDRIDRATFEVVPEFDDARMGRLPFGLQLLGLGIAARIIRGKFAPRPNQG